MVAVVEHRQIRTKAHARQAAHTQLFPHADDAPLIAVEGLGGADLDARAALVTEDGAEATFVVFVDTDVGFLRVGDLEPRVGAGLLADVAADTQFRIVG